MDLEGLLMVGIVGVVIAIGNHYEKNTIQATQERDKQEVKSGIGYISYKNVSYALINGKIEVLK